MCFYRTSKHKCSDTPITVYKVMLKVGPDCVNSIFYPALKPYLVGQNIEAWRSVSTETLDIRFAFGGEIVHAYRRLDRAILKIRELCVFHSTFNPIALVVVECEIPPGVEYWLGSDGEIGARELIITKIR